MAQTNDSIQSGIQSSAQRLMAKDSKLTVGGYGEVHYNQPLNGTTKNNGTLDVHRVVLLFGYKFNDRTQFITEIEFEHVQEVYVEQAFIQYKINEYINFRGGLLLTPMGIINEYHEPTTFNGVERPLIDKYIVPTTWREIGFGFTGNIFPAKVRYQAYLMNGFSSYDGSGNLDGKNGLRKGRQKGAESFISAPNFSGKIEFYGVRGLNLGVSGYFGNTQSTIYHGIEKNDSEAIAKADSSVTGISMLGLDARYSMKGLQLRGQYYYTQLSNTYQYNVFTASDGKLNDLGSSMFGYYVEAAYNVFRHLKNTQTELIPFVRYEAYNTQNTVEEEIIANKAHNNTLITTGLTWKLAKGAVLKADMQFLKSEADSKYAQVFNAGFGVMF
jgi:hypothetical protein